MAGESAAEDIDGFDIVRSDLSDIVVAGDAGPVFVEDALAIGVLFAEPERLEATRAFESKVISTDTGEEGANCEHN